MSERSVIWVASYPKSGNTWVASILEVAGRGYGYPQGKHDPYVMEATGQAPPACPAVAPEFAQNPCSILKTHSPFKPGGQPHRFPGLDFRTVGFVHIYRNPLDVLLSYIGFTRMEYEAHKDNEAYRTGLFKELLGFSKPYDYDQWLGMGVDAIPQKNLDHALNCFSANELSIPILEPMSASWSTNLQSWLDAANNYPGHSLRYEDCLGDDKLFAPLERMFVFNTADVMNAVEFVNARARRISAGGSQTQKIFFNKLSSYYYTRYFSKGALDRFFGEHQSVLEKYGYSELVASA